MAGGTVILTYHRVARDLIDPHLIVVDPSHFGEHLSRLGQLAEPVSLHDILDRSSGPRVAITLDDGYADNVTEAMPRLEAEMIPATVFITSAMVGARREFWPDRLERSVRNAPTSLRHVRLDVGGTAVTVDIGSETARRRAMWALHARLRPRPPGEIDSVLDALAQQLDTIEDGERRRPVNPDEVRQLAASPVMTVGAHTRRHPWLASLDVADQNDEIVGGRAELEELVGEPVDLFAYPYGMPGSYDRRTVRIVRRAGFTLACTTHGDPLTRLTSRYRLPRRSVLDWDGDEFEQHLRRWLDE